MGKTKKIKSAVGGFLAFNVVLVLTAVVFLFLGTTASAQEQNDGNGQQVENQNNRGMENRAVGAALAVGLAAVGSGIAVGVTGSAAIGGMTQNPDIFGRSLVFVGLAEGISIYGLIISFMILTGGMGG